LHCHAGSPDSHSFPPRRSSDLPVAVTSGSPTMPPFWSSRIDTLMRTSCASDMPGMIDQLFWIWPRSASISLMVSLVPLVVFLPRSEEHTSELQSRENLVCRLLL